MYLFPLREVLWANACVFIVMASVTSSVYAVIVFCAYKVSQKVKSVKNWSASAHDANKQIHAALLFQAAAPLILDVVPSGVGITAILGGFQELTFIYPFFTCFLALIPAANALSTILFIKCYRRALSKFVVNALCRFVGRLGWKAATTPYASHTAVSPLPSGNQR